MMIPKIDTFTKEELAEIVKNASNQVEALRAMGYTGQVQAINC